MATVTLDKIAAAMTDFNRRVAPGGECAAWEDFVADCYERYDVAPWDDAAENVALVQDFVDYWLRVSRGENYEYDAKTGARLEI